MVQDGRAYALPSCTTDERRGPLPVSPTYYIRDRRYTHRGRILPDVLSRHGASDLPLALRCVTNRGTRNPQVLQRMVIAID